MLSACLAPNEATCNNVPYALQPMSLGIRKSIRQFAYYRSSLSAAKPPLFSLVSSRRYHSLSIPPSHEKRTYRLEGVRWSTSSVVVRDTTSDSAPLNPFGTLENPSKSQKPPSLVAGCVLGYACVP